VISLGLLAVVVTLSFVSSRSKSAAAQALLSLTAITVMAYALYFHYFLWWSVPIGLVVAAIFGGLSRPSTGTHKAPSSSAPQSGPIPTRVVQSDEPPIVLRDVRQPGLRPNPSYPHQRRGSDRG
jgi:hypothetical protein